MNYSGLQLKLRARLHEFVGKLSPHFSKPQSRFVEQMLYGIQASGDVKLSRITRMLNEEIAPLKTETRLSRNLSHEQLEQKLLEGIVRMGSRMVHQDTLLLLDPTDVCKMYARKMEHLAHVRDGSRGEVCKGYWMMKVVACERGKRRMMPLYQSLYSSHGPGFVSENEEIIKAVDLISGHTNGRGIWVMDRGGSRKALFAALLARSLRFIIRLRADGHLMYRGKRYSALDLSATCPMLYSEGIVKEDGDGTQGYTLHYGYRPVQLPGQGEQLYLIVVRGFGQEPLLLLTNKPTKRTRASLWSIVEGYLTRWRIEESIRFIKQSYQLEDIRVQSYQRLKNLVALVLCAAYFAAVYLGEGLRLQVLTRRIIKAAKRFFGAPDFHYYALADGIAAIFRRSTKGPLCAAPVQKVQDRQQWLFNTS